MIPLDTLASTLCADVGDTTRKHKMDMIRWILDAYSQFRIYISNEVAVKSIIIDCTNSIPLPCDYVRWTKVGAINPQTRRIAVLSLDPTMRSYPTDCQTPSDDVQNAVNGIFDCSCVPEDGYFFHNVYDATGRGYGELYGYGGGFNVHGYFNEDRNRGVINFSTTFPEGAQMVLEYISDGLSDGLKLIPQELSLCLQAHAKFQYWMRKRDGATASFWKQEYMMEFIRVKQLYADMPCDYYAHLFRAGGSATVNS